MFVFGALLKKQALIILFSCTTLLGGYFISSEPYLKKDVYFYERTSSTLQFNKPQNLDDAKWQSIENFSRNKVSLTQKELWFYFDIHTSKASEWVVGIRNPLLKNLKLQVFRVEKSHSGETLVPQLPPSPLKGLIPLYNLNLQTNETYRVFTRVMTPRMVVLLPFLAIPLEGFQGWYLNHVVVLGFILGALTILIGYSFILSFQSRHGVYYAYIMLQIAVTSVFFIYSGLFQQTLQHFNIQQSMDFFVRSLWWMALVSSSAAIVLVRHFFNIGHNYPKLEEGLKIFQWFPVVFALTASFLPTIFLVASGTLICTIVLSIYIGFMVYSFNSQVAYTFLIAGLGTIGLAILLGLGQLGLSPLGEISDAHINFVILWQALFLALAIGTKMRALTIAQRTIKKVLKGELPETQLQEVSGDPMTKNLITRDQLVTIMFIDIVGFSLLSKQHSSQTMFDILSHRLKFIKEVVREFNGVIDRSLGDGVLCFFGGTQTKGYSSAEQALKAAIKIQQITVTTSFPSEPILPVRIGLHTDTVTIGDLSYDETMDFTLIGSGVNLASRLESACSPNKIMLSVTCMENIKSGNIDEEGIRPVFIQMKHHEGYKKAYEYNIFHNNELALREFENAFMNQIGRKNKDNRHNVANNFEKLSLTCDLGPMELVDFSKEGIATTSDFLLGIGTKIELTLVANTPEIEADLQEKLLSTFEAEVRWNTPSSDGYKHGLQLTSLSEPQREYLFNKLVELYFQEEAS